MYSSHALWKILKKQYGFFLHTFSKKTYVQEKLSLEKIWREKIHCLQDVSKKDFPCGDLKEEKGIQVFFLFIWPSLRCLCCWRLHEYYYQWFWNLVGIGVISKSSYSVFIHFHLHHQRYHFQRLEAMVWALDRINLSPNLLPNITLGNKKVQHCYPGLIDGTQIVKSFEGLNICQVLRDWEIERSIRKGYYIFKICIN